MPKQKIRRLRLLQNTKTAQLVILVITGLLSIAILVKPFSANAASGAYKVGDVSPQDIQAPQTLSYVSEVLTEQARKEAEANITPIYLPADPGITRKQIASLQSAINYINVVRADTYATPDQKLEDLDHLSGINLQDQLAETILNLGQDRWKETQQEALSVLEIAMRSTIKDNQVYEVRRSVPTLINFNLPETQATIIEELVKPFITATSLYSEEQTLQAIEAAQSEITQVTRKFIVGEAIVSRGQIITPLIREALVEFGLIQTQTRGVNFIAALSLVALTIVVTVFYFSRMSPPFTEEVSSHLVIAISFVLFLFGAQTLIPNRTVIPYIYPLPAFGLTVASLFPSGLGIILSILLSILAAFSAPYSLDLTLFYMLASLIGIMILGKGRRISTFFWAGLGIATAGAAIVLAYRIPALTTDWLGIITLIGAAFFNGFASAGLTLLLQFLFSQILGITTSLQLLDLSRPDHPLLQMILQNAPGTYQHSLQVANLAEQAAKAIGADALLVRVGALHHDAGKALNPLFFIENQVGGKLDPHNDMAPLESSKTIIAHVTDGVKLARKFRLPERIQDFIREHHGTMVTRYQYNQATRLVADGEEVDIDAFRYPGPKPESPETALLMLADGCEARARAEVPKNDEEIRALVKNHIEYIHHEQQLDNTSLTLKQLNLVAESFITTLRNTYHPRIRYPEPKSAQTAPEKMDILV
ncbi:MAG: HDIG domain-containing protein [Anaerolineaceae bacterium]|nr:HDIG domain-containing protein [Anaerolineaceae bacterium]